jgi:hypothetical protein
VESAEGSRRRSSIGAAASVRPDLARYYYTSTGERLPSSALRCRARYEMSRVFTCFSIPGTRTGSQIRPSSPVELALLGTNLDGF